MGGVEALAQRDRIRRDSDDTEESMRRGRFRRSVVLPDSLAPSPIGPVRVEEAWVEAEKRTQFGIFGRETGRELLVLRIDTESSDAYVLVQGRDWPQDTLVVYAQRFGGPRVRFSSRERQPPDTLRFLEGRVPDAQDSADRPQWSMVRLRTRRQTLLFLSV